jgi:hypothetical protein
MRQLSCALSASWRLLSLSTAPKPSPVMPLFVWNNPACSTGSLARTGVWGKAWMSARFEISTCLGAISRLTAERLAGQVGGKFN